MVADSMGRLIDKEEHKRESVGVRDLFDTMALLLFGSAAERLAQSFNLYENIRRAGLYIHPKLYVARILLRATLIAVVSTVTLFIAIILGAPLLVNVLILLAAMMSSSILISWGLYYPSAKASERASKVDLEFPFFAAYMTAMAYGGVAPERLIERLTNIRVFRALRQEAERIMAEVKLFGMNILTALERVAATHPSRLFRDFMLGYLTAIRTGGDVVRYLEIRTSEVFQARMEDLRSRAEKVGFIIEAFVAVAVLGTMSFYVFFIISGLIGTGGGFGGITGLVVYNLLVLPLITILIIMILDSLLPSAENIREPYAYLVVSIPLGILLGSMILSLSGGLTYAGGVDVPRIQRIVLSLGIGLTVASLIPGVQYLRIVRRERAVSRGIASFLRDLSEVRRTGLSPEKSIIMLSERDYGPLSQIIRRIAGALSLGLHIERAVRSAIRGYKNWFLRVTMRFLVDAMEVGGGSPHTIDTLARFMVVLNEINEQIRKRVRPYVIMPYFGAILVAVTAILVPGMLVNAMTAATMPGGGAGTVAGTFGGLNVNITPQNIHQLLVVASLGSLINAWLSGLVAGKIQDQSLGAGLLHAAILTAVTTIALFVALAGMEVTL
jgi:flagellar protein FlaJ